MERKGRGRIVRASMRLPHALLACSLLRGPSPIQNSPPSFPFVTISWVGWALWVFLGRSAGAQSRAEAIEWSSASRERCFGNSPWVFSTSHMRKQQPVPRTSTPSLLRMSLPGRHRSEHTKVSTSRFTFPSLRDLFEPYLFRVGRQNRSG